MPTTSTGCTSTTTILDWNALRANAQGPDADRIGRLIDRRQEGYYRYLEQRLGTVGGRKVDDLPNAMAYVQRLSTRPAYKKAMTIAGPGAQPPA